MKRCLPERAPLEACILKGLLFSTLKEHILGDGEVVLSEQFYLLKTLYADGKIDDGERRFIRQLREEVTRATPEFDRFCREVLAP